MEEINLLQTTYLNPGIVSAESSLCATIHWSSSCVLLICSPQCVAWTFFKNNRERFTTIVGWCGGRRAVLWSVSFSSLQRLRSPTTVCCIATFCFLVCAFAVPLLACLQNLGRLIFGRSLSVLCLLLVDPCWPYKDFAARQLLVVFPLFAVSFALLPCLGHWLWNSSFLL